MTRAEKAAGSWNGGGAVPAKQSQMPAGGVASPRSGAQHPESGSVPPPAPRAWFGRAPQSLPRVRGSDRTLGGWLVPRVFPDFCCCCCWRISGLGRRTLRPAATGAPGNGGLPTRSCPARAAARGGAAVSVSRPRAGAVPPRRRAPRPRGPRSAPEPWGAARGPGCGRSPGDVVSGPRASARPRAWLREPGAPERGKTPPARRELPPPRLPLQDSPGFWSTWEGN